MFLSNLRNVTFISSALGRDVRLRVSSNTIKSVRLRGDLNAHLLKAKATELSPHALELNRAVEKKKAAPERKASGEFALGRVTVLESWMAGPKGPAAFVWSGIG